MISTKAKMDARIRETGKYGVSILAGDQEPLSLHFAKAAHRPDLVRFVWRSGVPLLDSALVHLSCTLEATYPAGDHSLHEGWVEELGYDDGNPLVFYAGSFRSLAVVGRDEPWGF
jgi:flavin reductase (DIM6/NTAB) family NADH-FMN oxidoreductase RutF